MSANTSPVTTPIDFDREGKQTSNLRVPHSRNASAWGSLFIPIAVIKKGSGPTVLFTGGLHGGEYEGPVSLMKLVRDLEPAAVSGRVIVVPALNLPAVEAGQRLSPIDHKDMNRVFPGDPRGSISEVIAHYVTHALVSRADFVVDIHSGGYSLDMVPYISMHYLDNPAQTRETMAALRAFQAPVGLVIREISGAGLLDYVVEGMGKVFLCGELGGAGRLSPSSLRIAETGVWNLLKHFGILDGQPVTREASGLPATRLLEVPGAECYALASADGIYESFLELGDEVQADQAVGQIHFPRDPARPPETLRLPPAGTLLSTRAPGFVERGDTVAVVARDFTAGASA
jgi:N-alpha-acetyl-L-2,4-diaminobutyrate deacetylase